MTKYKSTRKYIFIKDIIQTNEIIEDIKARCKDSFDTTNHYIFGKYMSKFPISWRRYYNEEKDDLGVILSLTLEEESSYYYR